MRRKEGDSGKQGEKLRNSSLELLRIVSMIMVLCLHINTDLTMTQGIELSYFCKNILYIIESLAIVAVNCFVLISGYFSVTSDRLKVRRIFDIIFETSIYGIFIYFGYCISGEQDFNGQMLNQCALPYFYNKSWFINVYVILSILAPFVNKALVSLSKKQYQALLGIMLTLFSIWKTFVTNPPSDDYGYGIISFVLIYMIGGYLRLHFDNKVNPFLTFFLYLAASSITCALYFLYGRRWINYNSIFVIIASVLLFLTFANMRLNSKVINYIARSVLAVYIIHSNQLIRGHIFLDYFGIQNYIGSGFLFAYYIFTVLGTFVICILIDIARQYLFKYTFDKLFDKAKTLNRVYKI